MLLLVPPFGISLAPSPCFEITVSVGVEAAVVPSTVATPGFGVGTLNAGNAPICGCGK